MFAKSLVGFLVVCFLPGTWYVKRTPTRETDLEKKKVILGTVKLFASTVLTLFELQPRLGDGTLVRRVVFPPPKEDCTTERVIARFGPPPREREPRQ